MYRCRVNNIPSTPKGQQSGEKNQKDADIKSPDERIATFTGWLVFVACIQALIFIAQGIAMWIQAKHLRGTVEATEKAANVAELSARAVIRLEMPIIQASPPDVIITSELIEDDGPYGGSFNHAHPTKYSVVNRIYFKNYER